MGLFLYPIFLDFYKLQALPPYLILVSTFYWVYAENGVLVSQMQDFAIFDSYKSNNQRNNVSNNVAYTLKFIKSLVFHQFTENIFRVFFWYRPTVRFRRLFIMNIVHI